MLAVPSMSVGKWLWTAPYSSVKISTPQTVRNDGAADNRAHSKTAGAQLPKVESTGKTPTDRFSRRAATYTGFGPSRASPLSADLCRQPLAVAVLDKQLAAVLYEAVTPGQSGRELHAYGNIADLIGADRNRLPIAGFLVGSGRSVFESAAVCDNDRLAGKQCAKLGFGQPPSDRVGRIRPCRKTAGTGLGCRREGRLSSRRDPRRLTVLWLVGCNLLLWNRRGCRRCRRGITRCETADIGRTASHKWQHGDNRH